MIFRKTLLTLFTLGTVIGAQAQDKNKKVTEAGEFKVQIGDQKINFNYTN